MTNWIINLPQVTISQKYDKEASKNAAGSSIGYKTKWEVNELPNIGIGVNSIISVDIHYHRPECTIITTIGGAEAMEHFISLTRNEVIARINNFIQQRESDLHMEIHDRIHD